MDDIQQLRDQLNSIDMKLLHTLLERMQTINDIRDWKREHNQPALQPIERNRKKKIFLEFAKQHALPIQQVEQLFDLLHQMAIERQAN